MWTSFADLLQTLEDNTAKNYVSKASIIHGASTCQFGPVSQSVQRVADVAEGIIEVQQEEIELLEEWQDDWDC